MTNRPKLRFPVISSRFRGFLKAVCHSSHRVKEAVSAPFSAPKTGNCNARVTITRESSQPCTAVAHSCRITVDIKHVCTGGIGPA